MTGFRSFEFIKQDMAFEGREDVRKKVLEYCSDAVESNSPRNCLISVRRSLEYMMDYFLEVAGQNNSFKNLDHHLKNPVFLYCLQDISKRPKYKDLTLDMLRSLKDSGNSGAHASVDGDMEDDADWDDAESVLGYLPKIVRGICLMIVKIQSDGRFRADAEAYGRWTQKKLTLRLIAVKDKKDHESFLPALSVYLPEDTEDLEITWIRDGEKTKNTKSYIMIRQKCTLKCEIYDPKTGDSYVSEPFKVQEEDLTVPALAGKLMINGDPSAGSILRAVMECPGQRGIISYVWKLEGMEYSGSLFKLPDNYDGAEITCEAASDFETGILSACVATAATTTTVVDAYENRLALFSLLDGSGDEENRAKKFPMYSELAKNKEDTKALLKVAEYYDKGWEPVVQSKKKAVEIYERICAVEPQAMINLGNILIHGVPEEGIEIDGKRAFALYSEAADNHQYKEAYLGKGVCYNYGVGVDIDFSMAAKCYEKAGNSRNGLAKYKMGAWYETGQKPYEKDIKKAVQLYEEAAEQGSVHAKLALAKIYYYGREMISKDYTKAFELLSDIADDNAEAMNLLGICYERGNGCPEKNAQKAVECYRKAADKGLGVAQHNLGYCYSVGFGGLPKDCKEAVYWYLKASASGYRGTKYKAAEIYYNGGENLPVDYEKALQLFHEAAEEEKNAAAMAYIGFCYEQGNGTGGIDLNKAVEWYQRGADGQNAFAQRKMAYFCRNGLGGASEDFSKALEWYSKAAQNGNSDAKYELAKIYYCGMGDIAVNYKEAFRLFSEAADQDARAMTMVGICYENGQGVKENAAEAAEWYRKGSEAGNNTATKYLADFYRDGKGVAKDIKKAIELYEKAGKKGVTDADYELALVYYFGSGNEIPVDYGKAYSLFNKIADKDFRAMNYKGICLEYGYGVKSSVKEAVRCYEKGVEMAPGNAYALYRLAYFYCNGIVFDPDIDKAIELYSKSTHEPAKLELADIYYYGKHDVTIDYKKAFDLYCEAAATIPKAMNMVGLCYENATGTDRDMRKAAEWYQKGADAGDSTAQYNLARFYRWGLGGLGPDCAKAVEWYAKSIEESGNIWSRHDLAEIYYNGEGGVEKDYDKAFVLFREAAQAGYQKSYIKLAECYEHGNGMKKADLFEAYRLYLAAGSGKDASRLKSYMEMHGMLHSQADKQKFRIKASQGQDIRDGRIKYTYYGN